MKVSQLTNRRLKHRNRKYFLGWPLATLVILGGISLSGAITAAWFAGVEPITSLFAQLQAWQDNPHWFLEVPPQTDGYILAPTVACLSVAIAVMKLSIKPRPWSRLVIVGILLGLTLRYLAWRSLSTLNLSDPLNGVFSLGLFFLELLVVGTNILQLFLNLRAKDRSREADRMSVALLNGSFTPSVDIFIPTYNEPTFILERTIIGCQALDYPHKKIYLLDDTRRPQMQQLAAELGCNYITRPDNLHAKAGNLNHAISLTNGELIVVFDADFIPTKNFLTRTVGFFQNPRIALLQTPQNFYNTDPIARNLGLEEILNPEEEVFHRQIQILKDAIDSVFCTGTSFIVRRQVLEATGGFVTESLSEDLFTGIQIAATGDRCIYLNEKLSAGLAADNISDHIRQRIRWARGTMQAFFIPYNPLTIRGLNWRQRLSYLEGLTYWMSNVSRAFFMLMPLAYAFLDVIPVEANWQDFLYFILPYAVVQFAIFSWFNYRSRSALLSEIYSSFLCFPIALTILQALVKPFSSGFKVTPKGTSSDRIVFNWGLSLPLLALSIGTIISIWDNTLTLATAETFSITGLALGCIWSVYNTFLLGISLLILIDIPKGDNYEWYALNKEVKIQSAEQFNLGITTRVSEAGAEVILRQPLVIYPRKNQSIVLYIPEEKLQLSGQIIQVETTGNFPRIRVEFCQINLLEKRQLIELLYCRPGQWKNRQSPGEWRSLLILINTLLKPRVLWKTNPEKIPIPQIKLKEGHSSVTY